MEMEGVRREYQSLLEARSLLKIELDDEKFTIIFNTATGQAADMMNSCEKILDESQAFITQFNSRIAEGNNSEVEKTFFDLFKSLRSKIKYYSPATSRVLKSVDKLLKERSQNGINNGIILRQNELLKNRFKVLSGRMDRIEKLLEVTLRDSDLLSNSLSSLSLNQPNTPKSLPKSAPNLTRSFSTPIIKPPPALISSRDKSAPPARPIKSSFRTSTSNLAISSAAESTPPPRRLPTTPSTYSLSSTKKSRPPPSNSATANLSSTTKPRWNVSTRPIKEPDNYSENNLEILSESKLMTRSRSNSRVNLNPSRSTSRMSFSKFNGTSDIGIGRQGSISPTFSNYSVVSNATTNGGGRDRRSRAFSYSKIPLPSFDNITPTAKRISTFGTNNNLLTPSPSLSTGLEKEKREIKIVGRNRKSMLPVAKDLEKDKFGGRLRASTSLGTY